VSETRKIAAILVADVVGYSRLQELTRTGPSRVFYRTGTSKDFGEDPFHRNSRRRV
jgi:hypothetical protein